MNILQTIITVIFICVCFFGLLMTLTINSWSKPSEENDDKL